MIDIHSHIIFGVDDGSKTIEESIAIIRRASEAGITTMVATPHFIKGSMDTDPVELKEKLEAIKQALSKPNNTN